MTQTNSDTPDSPEQQHFTELGNERVDWIGLASPVWTFRKFIVGTSIAVTVLAGIVSMVLPEYFRSTASLLPETEKNKLATLGGISDLAALAGLNVGGDGALARLYPTIIKSEAVLRPVIFAEYRLSKGNRTVNLLEFWDIKESLREREYEMALRRLREELAVSHDNRTGVVSLSISTRDAELSAAIVNNIVSQLDSFIRTKRTTNAGEQRKWIEQRLVDVKEDLDQSEDSLKEFREKNRRIMDSPELLLKQGRLAREVEINSTIYVELKKQYELTRIEEIKNVPIINVLDSARPETKKESPKRTLIVLSSLVLSLVGAIVFVVIRSRFSERITELVQIVVGGSSREPEV